MFAVALVDVGETNVSLLCLKINFGSASVFVPVGLSVPEEFEESGSLCSGTDTVVKPSWLVHVAMKIYGMYFPQVVNPY